MLRVISVTSGKGGVGKTHLAANVATICARAGLKVLAIDADTGLANLDLILGLYPSRHVGHLLDGATLDEVVLQTASGVSVLPGAPGERRLVHLDAADQRALVSAWDELASRYDVVVLDSGPGVGDDTLFFTATGQHVVLVVTEEPTSLADAAGLLAALRARTAIRQVDVVVNGVRTGKSAQAVFARLQTASLSQSISLRFLGHVPEDQNVRRAAMLRKPLVELAPTSPASRAFERLTELLLGSRPGPAAGISLGLAQQLGAPPPPGRGEHRKRGWS